MSGYVEVGPAGAYVGWRCRDCKFWGHHPDIRAMENAGYCELTQVDVGEPEHPESKAISEDRDFWESWLVTAPDFGCIQWQSKETKE